MAIVCGIEEAGRGPVIGPMVMAGVIIDEKDEHKLADIGVKDSKMLTPSQREVMFERIKLAAKKVEIIILAPEEIDNALINPSTNLNWLEADTSIRIIKALKPEKAILDCPSHNPQAYADYVKNKADNVEIIAEHKADEKYPVVSAASIIAKVTRDREIEKIKDKVNANFGSGYPSDPLTVKFLHDNYDKYGDLKIFRKTWASYRNILKSKGQKSMSDY